MNSYDKLARMTTMMYMADWRARLFNTSYQEELDYLKALNDEDYDTLVKRIANGLSKLPCPECGCKQNGQHE